jgi:hypothetical protein
MPSYEMRAFITVAEFNEKKAEIPDGRHRDGRFVDAEPEVLEVRADNEPEIGPAVDPSLFSTPPEILAMFVSYAGFRAWPVTGLPDHLHEQMSTDHVSSPERVLTLDVWLGDLPTTFESLAAWIGFEQRQLGRGFWRYYGLKSDAKHLRLLNPGRYGKKPSVRWVEVDLTANWEIQKGVVPHDVRDPETSAGLQVMTAVAVHPAYPLAIDGKTIPLVFFAWSGSLADPGGLSDFRCRCGFETTPGAARYAPWHCPALPPRRSRFLGPVTAAFLSGPPPLDVSEDQTLGRALHDRRRLAGYPRQNTLRGPCERRIATLHGFSKRMKLNTC